VVTQIAAAQDQARKLTPRPPAGTGSGRFLGMRVKPRLVLPEGASTRPDPVVPVNSHS
jgi:hypothetical protein